MSKKATSSRKAASAPRQNNRILLLCCLAAAVVILVLLLVPANKPVTYGDFTPPPFDPAAVSGAPEVPAELGWSEIQIRQGLSASVCGVLNEADGEVAVWFYNHPDSDSWLKLRLMDTDGNILGETGLLRPGEHVQYLTLDTVPRRETTVILRVMGYEPETYYSAGSLGLQTTLIPGG